MMPRRTISGGKRPRKTAARPTQADAAADNASKRVKPSADEEALESWLFGAIKPHAALEAVSETVREATPEEPDETAPTEEQLFVIDKTRRPSAKSANLSDSEDEGSNADGDAPPSSERRPAWHDEDDDQLEVDLTDVPRLRKLRTTEAEAVVSGGEFQRRLRQQHARLRGARVADEWAALPAEADGDALDPLLTTRRKLAAASSAVLPSGTLDVSVLRDANRAAPMRAVVQALAFHPTAPVVLTGGFDQKLSLFQLDGKTNALMQRVALDGFPIYQAAFARGGREVVIASRRPHYHVYDVEAGRVTRVPGIMGRTERSLERLSVSPDGSIFAFGGDRGSVVFVSATTRQPIGTVKMNHGFADMTWADDGRTLYSLSDKGDVYEWDVAERRARWRFHDEGSLHGTAIAAGPGGLLACGSNTGIVNLYDVRARRNAGDLPAAPTPDKVFMNLTTSISSLCFNHDGQMLLFASRAATNGVRAAHTRSHTVFSNWPNPNTSMRHVNVMATSPNSGFLATGNDTGSVRLYRLNHYPAY